MLNCVLAVNAGSGTIKLALFSKLSDDFSLLYKVSADKLQSPYQLIISDQNTILATLAFPENASEDNFYSDAISLFLEWLKNKDIHIVVVSHRVVHGGMDFTQPVIVTNQIIEKLKQLIPLAPLHQPNNIQGIIEAQLSLPNCPQVVCFDTAFHSTNPKMNHYYAIPQKWETEGVRRYGFHGLSYAYITRQLEQKYPDIAHKKIIIAHLGQGASLCALNEGKSILTTMGFTALDGLVMGTRCGMIDPGILLYWMNEKKMTGAEITDLLYYQSGLKGLSGISSDMRTLLHDPSPNAALSIDIFVQRVNQYIGLLTAELGGLDALVFTAGIGENAPTIRAAICERAHWLGVQLNATANLTNLELISSAESAIPVYRIPTNEEYMLAFYADSLCHSREGGNPS